MCIFPTTDVTQGIYCAVLTKHWNVDRESTDKEFRGITHRFTGVVASGGGSHVGQRHPMLTGSPHLPSRHVKTEQRLMDPPFLIGNAFTVL
ncbi:hypothetical protein E2C01_016863 [Portunus trituberculatus]|uniref:Uncharacterized protein n=1 Tax=Portunus trituberculatus TaxID=210409 RepID=A0A5B7DRN2_PORTR|nr:hypothetical protein [Portunus trituberculatus]